MRTKRCPSSSSRGRCLWLSSQTPAPISLFFYFSRGSVCHTISISIAIVIVIVIVSTYLPDMMTQAAAIVHRKSKAVPVDTKLALGGMRER